MAMVCCNGDRVMGMMVAIGMDGCVGILVLCTVGSSSRGGVKFSEGSSFPKTMAFTS